MPGRSRGEAGSELGRHPKNGMGAMGGGGTTPMGAAPPPWGLGQEFQPNHTRNWGGNTPKSPCLSFPIALIPVLPKSGVSPRTPQTLSWGLDQPTGYTQTPRNRVKTPQNRVKPTQTAAVAARC